MKQCNLIVLARSARPSSPPCLDYASMSNQRRKQPTTRRSTSRATASSMSAASRPRSTARPTSPARCMSNTASRRSRRIPIRSSWCTAARARARTGPARPTAAKAGRSISRAAAMRSMWSTSPAAAARPMCRRSTAPPRFADAESAQQRYLQQAKYKLWPQAHLHNAMARHRRDRRPGDAPDHRQLPAGDRLPEIGRDHATRRCWRSLDKIGPFIVLMHSQGGPIGWAAADARPDLVQRDRRGRAQRTARTHALQFVGAPDWFKDGDDRTALRPDADCRSPISPPVKDAVRDQMGEGGQAGRARSRHLLEAGRAGAPARRTCSACRSR